MIPSLGPVQNMSSRSPTSHPKRKRSRRWSTTSAATSSAQGSSDRSGARR